MRKLIYYLNLAFVTVALLAAILVGEEALAIYFYLAVFQLLTGLVLLPMNWLTYHNALPQILIYWLLVAVYFMVVVNWVKNDTLRLLVVPILIALYHCYTTYKLTRL